jgi:hypothetical protein
METQYDDVNAEDQEDQEEQAEKPDRGDDFTPDDDDEPAAEPGAAPEPEPDPAKEPMIPKSRFDEMNARMKAAEAAIVAEREAREAAEAVLKSHPQALPTTAKTAEMAAEIAKQNKEYHAAMSEGEFETAEQLMESIEAKRAELLMAQARGIAAAEVAEARKQESAANARAAAEARASEIAEQCPWLIDQSDPEAREMFDALRDAQVAKGRSVTAAMDYALGLVLKTRPEATPPAQVKSPASSLARKTIAASQQPPRASGVGVGNRAAGSTRPTKVAAMTEEQFESMTPAERRALRGDTV